MKISKGQVTVAPASGKVTVRRIGETSDRTVSATRSLTFAATGDWALLIEDEGQIWAVGLLGTAPTAPPSNPDPGGGVGPSTLEVPPAWVGTRTFTHPAGVPDGWKTSPDLAMDFGKRTPMYGGGAWRDQGVAVFPGLKGVALTSAVFSFTKPFFGFPSDSVQLALWLAPSARPADRPKSHPSMTLVASTSLGLPWPTGGSVALPASWLTHLKAGTANGVGLIDDDGPMADWLTHHTTTIKPLSVTYE